MGEDFEPWTDWVSNTVEAVPDPSSLVGVLLARTIERDEARELARQLAGTSSGNGLCYDGSTASRFLNTMSDLPEWLTR